MGPVIRLWLHPLLQRVGVPMRLICPGMGDHPVVEEGSTRFPGFLQT